MRKSSLKFKIIISLLLAVVTIVGAGVITTRNSRQIRHTVNQISRPPTEQYLVNELFKDIVVLDQVQRKIITPNYNNDVFRTSDTLKKKISGIIDSLRALNEGNGVQLERLELLSGLLHKRDQLIKGYQALTRDFIRSDSVQLQIERLSDFIHNSYLRSDSAMFKSRSSISSTTISDSLPEISEQKSTFWNRLFGKRKEPMVKEVRYFVLEQMNVSLDTLQLLQDDSIFVQLTNTLDGLQQKRKSKLGQLNEQRQALDEANTTLIREVLNTLNDIEQDNGRLLSSRNKDALRNIDDTLSSITILTVLFVIVILVMGALIAWDLVQQDRNRKALIAAKEEADRLGSVKQQFLSKMSHEIRSPLQSIIGYADLMLHTAPSRDQVQIISDSSRHLLEIVNQVLDYNKLVNDSLTLLREPFSISRVLDELKALASVQALHKQLSFEWHIQPDVLPWVLLGDAIRLKQILLNILHNAVKFTDEGFVAFGLTASKAGEHNVLLEFKIADSGQGIAQEDLDIIFKDFEQLPTRHMPEGSGLGLSIAKELIEKMGGTIMVSSRLGMGSEFLIRIPFEYAEPDALVAPARSERKDNSDFRGMVWVIDDDAYILQLCERILEHNHIAYRSFNHPSGVLEAEVPPQLRLIFLDIRMPDMMGYELVKILRERVPAEVRIIALTAQVLPDEVEHIKQQGFDDILNKPFLIASFEAYFKQKVAAGAPTLNPDEDEELLAVFTADTRADIFALEKALYSGDTEQLREICHKLASRLGQLGYKEEGQLARELEFKFKEGKLSLKRTRELIERLKYIVGS